MKEVHKGLLIIEPRFVCAAFGRRGADVRLDGQTVARLLIEPGILVRKEGSLAALAR